MGRLLHKSFAKLILLTGAMLALAGTMVAQAQSGPATDPQPIQPATSKPGHFHGDGPVTVPAPGGQVMQQGFTKRVTVPAPNPVEAEQPEPTPPAAAMLFKSAPPAKADPPADKLAETDLSPPTASAPALTGNEKPPARLDASHVMVQMAGQWASYETDLWNWSRHTASSDMDLEQAMLSLGKYDGQRLSRGWMATNALIAIQVKPFADGVKKWEQDYGRDFLLQRLHENVNYATLVPGAQAAQDAILRASRSDSEQLATLGYLYKDQAYSMQKHAWASKVQRGKDMKLQAYRAAPLSPAAVSVEELNRLAAPGRQTVETPYDPAGARNEFLSALKLGPRSAFAAETDPLPPPPLPARGRSATVTQSLGLAALMILGEDPTNADFLRWSEDPTLDQCVSLSRINMAQCLAAGHFVYETSFCIAQHQIIDMSHCLGKVSVPPATSGTN